MVTADESDPVVTVTCTDDRDVQCPIEADGAVRIPDLATPNAGSDGALVVIDTTRNVSYELWRAQRIDDASWRVEWGTINDLAADGIGVSGGSGSGLSRLVGMVRVSDLAAGRIDHALAVASSATCSDEWRAPAWSTDGDSDGPDCLPMGARLQLDPAIDLDALPLTEAERVVARALQRYGAYVVDSSSSSLAFFFEREPLTNGDDELGPVTSALGFRWDYDPLTGIPWEGLRVLSDPSF